METRKILKLEELIPSAAGRREFERWLDENGTGEVKRAIAENTRSIGSDDGGIGVSSFLKSATRGNDDEEDAEEEDADDAISGAFGKKSSANNGSSDRGASSSNPSGAVFDRNGKPVRWCDTQMASETQDRLGGAIFIEEEVSACPFF